MSKMPKHICFTKSGRFQLVIFGKRENGKSPMLLCKRFAKLEDAVEHRNQWLKENNPEKLEAIKKKESVAN